MINPLAQELNETLKDSVVGELISQMGKRLYFPKGIIAQGGEASKGDSWNYGYTGNVQTFTAPVDGTYQLEVWGAQGGGILLENGATGGLGGYSSGTVSLTAKTQTATGTASYPVTDEKLTGSVTFTGKAPTFTPTVSA